MSYDPNNIFARILRQEIPCQQVYEDDQVLAFKDIAPKAPIHILVLPKGEYINAHDFHEKADPLVITHFYQTLSKIARQHQSKGYRLISNCGPHGGQEVPHYHVHILSGCPLGPLPVIQG